MANINDFRRRRLAAAAGNPERESWWRYARWRAARILGGITIGLLITIYLIARFGFSLVQEATEPDRQDVRWITDPNTGQRVIDPRHMDPNTGRTRYVSESIFGPSPLDKYRVTVSPVPETPISETPIAQPPLH